MCGMVCHGKYLFDNSYNGWSFKIRYGIGGASHHPTDRNDILNPFTGFGGNRQISPYLLYSLNYEQGLKG